MNGGTRTLPNAMPHPTSAAPANSNAMFDEARMNSPKPMVHIAAQSNVSMRHLSANLEATGDNTANANNGMVVMRPASVLDSPSDSWICGTTGPTLVIGARRLVATRIMPVSKINVFHRAVSKVFSFAILRKEAPQYAAKVGFI